MSKLGLFFAVYDEAKEILNNPALEWEKIDPDYYRSNRYPVELVVSGIGKVYAAFGVSKLIPACGRILILGTSGGLGHEEVGGLYYLNSFVEHDMNVAGLGFAPGITPFTGMDSPVIKKTVNSFEELVHKSMTETGLLWKDGRGLSGDTFISDAETARQKREQFDASIVDMESAAVAKICKKCSRDVLAVRYITDNADHAAGNLWVENVKKAAVIFNSLVSDLVTRLEKN